MKQLLGAALLGALTFFGFERPVECHKNHCHGDDIQICNGSWKRYKEKREHTGPEGGAATASEACEAAVTELENKLTTEAPARCKQLHACATCPTVCGGCEQKDPRGQIWDRDAMSTSSKKRSDGKYECKVKTEVAFRCSCSACIKKVPDP